ncbi:MAG: hypothetical protein GY859_41445, partial [Desulfobacterales bacterium]|nr:hypothetical protein [Desulfobacterales bacterium]
TMIDANRSFKTAVKHFISSMKEAAEFNGVALEEIDWFIPHQANLRMFQFISRALKIPMEKFYNAFHNIGSAFLRNPPGGDSRRPFSGRTFVKEKIKPVSKKKSHNASISGALQIKARGSSACFKCAVSLV